MAIKGKELIEKRNILNEVRKNNMSLQELRFFSIYLSKINARDISTRTVRFPLSDFQKIMEFGRLNTAQLKATTDSLLGKVVSIPNERGGYTSFQLFKECTVDKNEFEEWYVEIDAHDKALPLMFDFKDKYFTYELWNALRLKSGNQLRMYEILKQYEKLGERKLPLTELRELLGIGEDEYPRWDNFKRRVLDGCQEALAENTDIRFEYEPIKVGRKITGVKFTIKKNTSYIDQLSLNEFLGKEKPLQASADVQADPNQVSFEDYDITAAVADERDEAVWEGALEPLQLTNEQIDGVRAYLVLVDPDKMPELPEYGNDIELRRYHYLDQKVAEMRRREGVNNKFAYLLGILKKDAQRDDD